MYRDYRRKPRIVRVMRRLEVQRINDLPRRVRWRCRELGITVKWLAAILGVSQSRVEHVLRRAEDKGTLTWLWFQRFDEKLKMSDVDGWARPFPDHIPGGQRIRLCDELEKNATRTIDTD